jgi:hypothetical protein
MTELLGMLGSGKMAIVLQGMMRFAWCAGVCGCWCG